MDIKQLITFMEVAKQKSFTRTAEILFLTQPTVSNHVKSLEQELGVHLFVRSKKQITLTNAGYLFHKYAKTMVKEYEQMAIEMERYTGTQEGALRLYASSVPIRYFLPKLMKAFHQRYPHVSFTITDSDSRLVVDNLLMGDTDFGFTGAYYSAAGVSYEPVFQDKLVLITSDAALKPANGHTWQFNELFDMHLIFRAEGSGTRKTVEKALEKAGITNKELPIIAYIDDTKSIVEMVKNGMGQAIVSNLEVEEEVKNKELFPHPIDVISEPRDFYFVYQSDQKNTAINRLFFQFVQQYFLNEASR